MVNSGANAQSNKRCQRLPPNTKQYFLAFRKILSSELLLDDSGIATSSKPLNSTPQNTAHHSRNNGPFRLPFGK